MASPSVWGPLLWSMMTDIANHHDLLFQTHHQSHSYASSFFLCLCFLLPCCFCRDSYLDYFDQSWTEQQQLAKQGKLIEWVHWLHNQVNDKLEKSDSCRISLEEFKRRIQCWKYASSPMQWFDFLFILAVNMESTNHFANKQKYLRQLFILLPAVWPFGDQDLKMWERRVPQVRDLNKTTCLAWVYDRYNKYCSKHHLDQPESMEQVETRIRKAFKAS